MIEINLMNVTNFGNTGLANHTDINMWTRLIFLLQPESLTAQIRHIFQKAHQINYRVFQSSPIWFARTLPGYVFKFH